MDENMPVDTIGATNVHDIGISDSDLKNLSVWATFVAVMNIIFGAFNCLSCILILPGVFQIISGINLMNATTSIKKYIGTKEKFDIPGIFENFRKYFLYSGITFIIGLVCTVIFVIIYVIIIAAIIANIGNGKPFNDLIPFGR